MSNRDTIDLSLLLFRISMCHTQLKAKYRSDARNMGKALLSSTLFKLASVECDVHLKLCENMLGEIDDQKGYQRN